ncbi:HlyD family type I secretion periplasmic adaptor subunit [Enterobacteriaceae bacterium BIT-l23]|uniref:HlyD family type I secretion periplasmic adaptor subunit n=1 Tax=Jejubacter sp. L23 TaxID=3092086 RepID=UPI001585A2B2|nr:HlyD family type I secretion periplasmic adaptor subunit [Enterobacteriaceae bacterium BIT-l23]
MKSEHHDFLPAVLEVQETPPSPLGRLIIWVVIALMTTSVCWAAFNEVDIVAVTRGKLAVTRLSRPVHAAVTADIAAVLVREGERVNKGQALVKLNDASLQAQHQENLLRQRLNRLHIARLDVLIGQYTKDNGEAVLPAELQQDKSPEVLAVQARLAAEIEADRQQKRIDRTTLTTLEAQLDSYQQQHQMAQALLPIHHRQYQAMEQLNKKKMTSDDSLLELRKTWLESRYNVSTMEAKVRESRSGYEQQVAEQAARTAGNVRKAEEERSERLNENALLRMQLKQLDALLAQYTLKAPVGGKVDALAFRDAGGAVEAAQEVLKIVPEGEKIGAEVWVSNQDVGFLRIGQLVTVKLDTFDFTRYGWVKGRLIYLAADATEDRENGLIYRAVIELDSDELTIDGALKKLEPGMSVSAEIKTGKRTLLSYLLSPMLEALDDVGKQR